MADFYAVMSRARLRIGAERRRQFDVLGYDAAHDDKLEPGSILKAAECYFGARSDTEPMPADWPWDAEAWSPSTRDDNLLRAGALAMAASDCAIRAKAEHYPCLVLLERSIIELASVMGHIENGVSEAPPTEDPSGIMVLFEMAQEYLKLLLIDADAEDREWIEGDLAIFRNVTALRSWNALPATREERIIAISQELVACPHFSGDFIKSTVWATRIYDRLCNGALPPRQLETDNAIQN